MESHSKNHWLPLSFIRKQNQIVCDHHTYPLCYTWIYSLMILFLKAGETGWCMATFATFNFHNILRMLQHNFRDFVIAHSWNKIYPKSYSVTANWNHSSYIVLYCDHAQTSDWLIIQIDRQNLLCEELHIQLEWQTSELIMNPRFFCFHF